jgi:hypothetical protein
MDYNIILINVRSPHLTPLFLLLCGRGLVDLVWFMVFNTTFNNISVISWWSHNVVSSTPRLREIQTHNISGDRH